jgi:hypothetical protein
MHRSLKITLPLLGVMFALMGNDAGCNAQTTGEQRERQQTNQLMDAMSSAVGMPAITRFREKRMLKRLYEDRDNPNLATYTYITDLNGHFHLVCQSLGYGIPYATQYSSPHKPYWPATNTIAMADQAEPNGLYPPAAAEGTWVECLDPTGKTSEAKPVYVEPKITVTPWPLAQAVKD